MAVAEAAARDRPEYVHPICIVAASAALAGRPEVAEKAIVALRQLDTTLRISNFRRLQSIKRPEDLEKWEEGLRLAGLPE